jgi:TolB-like protein/Flp pilus assembly protein TadD
VPRVSKVRYLFEDYVLDTDRRELRRNVHVVPVEPKVFDLLTYVLSNRERVVSKGDMITAIWSGRILSESTLTTCINGARAAIGDSGDEQRLIKTFHRKGIRFVGDAREESLPSYAGSRYDISDKPSIAVLPFQQRGRDPELERFTDELTEEVITGLSRVKGVWVIARNTMFTYKGQVIDLRTVAKELGVNYLLEGSIRQAEGRFRMTALLIEAETLHHVWAAKFDRVCSGIFDLQDELAQCVVASIQTQLIVSEGKGGCSARQSTRIGDLLARAKSRLYPPTAEGLEELVLLAEEVLRLDPNNGEACRLLATGLWHQAYIGFVPWDLTAQERVMASAQRAVVAEHADEYAHWVLALAHLMAGQHERALVSLRRALDINPNFSLAYGTIGTVLAWSGEPDESIAYNELALRINPSDPINSHRYFGLALAYYLGSRYKKALDYATLAVQLRPEWWLAQIIYSATLAQIGRVPDAQIACAGLLRLKRELTLTLLKGLPFAKITDRAHLADGLRKAGVPEE